MTKGLNLVAECTFTVTSEWKLASAWAGIQTFHNSQCISISQMNVFKLSGFFFYSRGMAQFNPHLLVQSKSVVNSLLERIKESLRCVTLSFVSSIDTMDVYDRLCTKIFPIVYQI